MQASLRELLRNGCFQPVFACCLLAGFAPAVLAQPETFGGNPDSSAFIRIPANTYDWTRHFRIGALMGMNISADFNIKGSFNISGNNPAQGIYDDGYVRTDNTGDPGGYTYYWGYDRPSQLNGTLLTLNATTSFSATGRASEDGGPFPGFDMAYGDNLWYWKHARVGWELGFGLLPIQIRDSQPLNGQVNRTAYLFDVSNPYGAPVIGSGSGTPYQGSPDGPGPRIPDQPTSYSPSSTRETVTGTHTLDVILYTVRLGPSFYWDITRQVGVSLGAGPAVGLVSGDLKYDEVIEGAHNTGQASGTGVVYGGYVNAAVTYHAVANGDFYVGAQYMPMGSTTIGGGGREAKLDLGGQVYIFAGINWPF